MSWTDCALGDVVTLKRGHDLPQKRRKKGLVPVVSSSGITGYHNEAKAEPPGVVTGRYGTLGEVFFVTEPYWPLNTALYAVDFHGNDPRFISYFLRRALKNYQSDKAAVPGVDRNVLHKLPARCPDLEEQKAIVSVLSTYDDLIENNRRRIALLEKAARLLYREWFVHFRFPGHEHVKIVDGVPEEWRIGVLKDILVLQRGFDLPVAKRKEGNIPVIGSTGEVGRHDTPKVTGPLVTTGRSGSLGSVYFQAKPCWPLNTSLWSKGIKDISPYYAVFLLRELDLKQYNGGVSVPTLDRNVVHRIPVNIPPPELVAEFDNYAAPIFLQVDTLKEHSSSLAAARDLLLPRLMDGRIQV